TYYSSYDPNSPGAALSVADGFPPVANAQSSVILTPPASPTVAQQDNSVEDPSHDLPLSSSQLYFESRPSLVRRPTHVSTHHIIIHPDATPLDIQFPTSTTWTARDVNDQDWATFLNHLFPQHHARANARVADRKIRAEVSHNQEAGSSTVEKLRSAQLDNLLESNNNNDEDEVETEEERSGRIESVITEWNEGFFLPRGLKVVEEIQPSSSPREQAPSSGRLGGRIEGHNSFPHHSRHGCRGHHGHHGHHGRRWHDNYHSHWNIDPNASHGYGLGAQRRRRGCGRDIPSILDPTRAHPLALGASGVHPYIGLGEAVRHTAAQLGDAARYTAQQISEAARLTGQQVEEVARSTASQVGDAGRLAGQQIEEAALQSAAHLAEQQTRGIQTWHWTHTFGPPSPPSPSSHRRQSTSSSSRSFPSSIPSDQRSSHLHHGSGANADITELTNAMEALPTPSTSERSDTTHSRNHSTWRQYKQRENERKVEIREMKLEIKQKILEGKEERKREKDAKKAIRDLKKSERKSEKRMRKAERRSRKLKEKMEKAEIKLLGKGSVNVLAKGDDSLTKEEKEWWKEKRFEEQEVGILEKED
ncbi:hypothetical protein GP486_004934, partial [Trichoglossum hirsutum]